ncbi:HDOD domain-containing protein [Methylomonas rosea]|uniref:HDOD domain-containing protein n=1 Tax=Methylomonas rosea TaxID=2952227 RepID=A0ABT1TSX3_9GAMM|nr:HDOD domain-containing protein [Methylomonas sp. WSC-7]MCQ8117882.1 HDOD domain-containing protein [Methylomonas sp. WSC-7]
MNWFSKLLEKNTAAKKPTPKAVTSAAENPSSQQTDSAVSKPSATHRQALTVAQLKKFAPLRDLDDAALSSLPHLSLTYAKGAIIFSLGQSTSSVLYLLAGQLSMQPDSDSRYQIDADSTLANLPLNSGSRCGATATALSDVRILEIPIELNRLWTDKSQESANCVELIDIQLPEPINGSRFFNSFAQAYRENKLRLPSLPDVALKLKDAVQKDIGIRGAAEIIQLDPPIVAKLIQVANSPLYATEISINNCHDAVARIGLNATRNLVMGISMKQLFSCTDPELMKGMQSLWKNSLYVSSLSFVLAQECSNINPEDALLGGLIADIGAIPLLHFAEQFPDGGPSFQELQTALPYLRGPVGVLMLHTLGFPEQLGNIPHQAENWLYDSGSELTMTDIVILAKLHSYFGSGNARDLPYINSIPSYSKLNHGKLNPDFSLMVLKKAQNRVNAAMHLLS